MSFWLEKFIKVKVWGISAPTKEKAKQERKLFKQTSEA